MKLPRTWSKKLRRLLPTNGRDWQMLLLGAGAIVVVVIGAIIIHNAQVPLKPEASTVTISWLPPTVKRWQSTINEMAKTYNIDPNLIAIIITMESGGYSKAHSDAGAEGLMQVTPPTAKDIAAKYLKQPRSHYDLKDPRTNIEFGTAYLAELRDVFGDVSQGPTWNSTVELVAAGYNGGPLAANHLEQGKGLHDTQTVVYSRDVFNMWRERHASSSPTFDRWKERGGSTLIDAAKAE